jgi:hypothetical protein
MIDSVGNKIIDFKYHKLLKPKCITPNRIIVTIDEGRKLKGIINRKNEKITSIKYNRIGTEFETFENGLIPVTYNSSKDNVSEDVKISHGYIDIFGNEYFED